MRSAFNFLEGQVVFSHARWSNNRSVMPLDVWGCTRTTMGGSACVYPAVNRDWGLKLFPINEEFPLSAGHKLALIKSLPFGHTARRYYRLDGLVRSSDRDSQRRGGGGCLRSPGAAPHETSERSSPGKAFGTDTYLQITRCR